MEQTTNANASYERVPTPTVIPLGGASNDLANLQAALNSGAKRVELFAGANYNINALLKVPDGVTLDAKSATLTALNDIPQDPGYGADHQGQMVALGNGAAIENPICEGNNHYAGGVLVSAKTGFLISNVKSRNATNGTNHSQGVAIVGSTDGIVEYCDIYRAFQGIQWWQSQNITIRHNKVRRVVGGIWGASGTDIRVHDNDIADCADLGLDMEGGIRCDAWDNKVTRCKNGELAFFTNAVDANGCHELTMRRNTARRQATYTDIAGASQACDVAYGCAVVHSLSDNATNCGFFDNDMTIDYGPAFTTHSIGLTDQGLAFSRNMVTHNNTTFPVRLYEYARGVRIDGNIWRINAIPTFSSLLKNMRNGSFSSNIIESFVTLSDYLFYVYTDNASELNIKVASNRFSGCGPYAMSVDQFVAGTGVVILQDNKFSLVPATNGGLAVGASSQPRYRDQVLHHLIADTSSTTIAFDLHALGFLSAGTNDDRPAIDILLTLRYGSVNRNAYRLTYHAGTIKSYDGTGSASGINASANTFISSISGSTINITKPSGTGAEFFARMLCNSDF